MQVAEAPAVQPVAAAAHSSLPVRAQPVEAVRSRSAARAQAAAAVASRRRAVRAPLVVVAHSSRPAREPLVAVCSIQTAVVAVEFPDQARSTRVVAALALELELAAVAVFVVSAAVCSSHRFDRRLSACRRTVAELGAAPAVVAPAEPELVQELAAPVMLATAAPYLLIPAAVASSAVALLLRRLLPVRLRILHDARLRPPANRECRDFRQIYDRWPGRRFCPTGRPVPAWLPALPSALGAVRLLLAVEP